jgi:PAB1-binding protein PBP1
MDKDFTNWTFDQVQDKLKSKSISCDTLKKWVIWTKANDEIDQLKQSELKFGVSEGFLNEEHTNRWNEAKRSYKKKEEILQNRSAVKMIKELGQKILNLA